METKCVREYLIRSDMEVTGLSIQENLFLEVSHLPITVLKIGVRGSIIIIVF